MVAHPGPGPQAGAGEWSPHEDFSRVFDAHFAEIHRYIARRLDTQTADDLAADTFLIAFRDRERFDPSRGGIRPWLYGIATNLLARHRRDEVRRWKALSRTAAGDDQESPEGAVTAKVSAQQVTGSLAGALAGLAKRDRDVVLLLALGDLSHAEVAAALGVPYGTVASRLNRARKQLREALGDVNPLKEALDG
ncbi:RNA polymerase sigma factor [Planobispora longispora]|uniref:DNA-directed RNA polymerase sigma-70 factor n=1 Tax=Planobispora longispora TaxID=28887 RepID=A0A8J3W7T4_9ACTN|nr:RNA polymerase sigma factor [Planobispora longispora]GIH79909.1 DNA-directed RNA polymerase sigma-70 factor [Planobispora longispora]